ncbi:anti-anti-sigma factor [Inhella inkyongensis]|uniref:Anti-anti-sigma factor n=1 Tax=Inhella inkyongensis TaxID=392593 RepID=A0A840S5J5_9BURK|nr:STAS domain-containing protein [Inhella inkyongensis]MBB5205665.1 anti-anti-sigma factor [Inhella inkyongensis]
MAEALKLGTEWTIPHAAQLHEQLLTALIAGAETAEAPVLDLGGVESMDSSGVQLLLALRRSLQERGQELQIVAASSAARAAMDTYHLRALLMPEA